jgi:hypothetical protein
MEREIEGGRTIIRMSGVLDEDSVSRLRRCLDEEPGDLVLDFSLVREFADLGVAALARSLAAAERRVTLRGLRQHQLRIFRYFGLDVDALRSRAPGPEARHPHR